MAISFIGSNTQDKAGGLDLTFTIPGGAQADDLILVCVKQSENTTQREWDDDGGGGKGYTRLAYNRSTSGRDQETAIYYKIHSGSESNPTFTWASGITTEPMSGSMLIYRGTDLINPIDNYNYAFQQNTTAANASQLNISSSNSAVVLFQAVTHDAITAVGFPAGYNGRTQVWNGINDDHRNHFTADIFNISAGNYDPPAFTHSASSTAPESHIYAIVLNEVKPIGVATYDNKLDWSDINKIVTGFGFGSIQGSGKVEFWSDLIGTIKSTQTIDSWSDTSIQFDLNQTTLDDNTGNYLVITNDNGDVTAAKLVSFGLVSYKEASILLAPDHWWSWDGDYNDTGVGGDLKHATSGVVGTQNFVSPIAENANNGWEMPDTTSRREIADSPFMNVTISAKERTVGGWIQVPNVGKPLSCIWKEGGGVQNLAFILGLGNVLMAQLADVAGSRDNVQAVASIKLTPNRPYHIALRYTHLESPKEMRLFLDGEEQPLDLTDGNPMVLGVFDSHSGDVTWGDPDGNLETGTTDISYNNFAGVVMNHWFSWSDNSTEGGAVSKTDIKNILFRRGALPKYTIITGTESVMQSNFDTQLQNTEVEDWPLGLRVNAPSSGVDLELTANGVTFDERCTAQIEWRGRGALTYIVGAGSTIDENKCFVSNGGSIVFEYPATFTIAGILSGSIVEIYDNEVVNIGNHDTKLASTNSSGTAFQYAHDGSSNDVIVKVFKDGYQEVKIPFTLGSVNQTLPVDQLPDNN